MDKASSSGSSKEAEREYFHFLLRSGLIFAAGSLASYFRVICFGRAADNIASKLRRMLFTHYLHKDVSFFDETRTAELSVVLEKDTSLASDLFTDRLASALRSVNSSLFGSILLYRTSPQLSAVALSVVPLIGIGAMTLNKSSKRLTDALRTLESEERSFVTERLASISTVHVNMAEGREERNFEALESKVKGLAGRKHAAAGALLSYLGVMTNLSLLAVLAVGGRLIASSDLTAGDLSRFAIQSVFVGLGFGGLSTAHTDMVKALEAANRLDPSLIFFSM